MTPSTFNGQPTKANPPPSSAMPQAQIEPSIALTEIYESSDRSAADFGVSGSVETVESPSADKAVSESPQVINLQSDKTNGQRRVSTHGQGFKKADKSARRSTTKKTAIPEDSEGAKIEVSSAYAGRFRGAPRDNRWQLSRLHGRKLSANGRPMWAPDLYRQFYNGGIERFYERE